MQTSQQRYRATAQFAIYGEREAHETLAFHHKLLTEQRLNITTAQVVIRFWGSPGYLMLGPDMTPALISAFNVQCWRLAVAITLATGAEHRVRPTHECNIKF